MTALGASGVVTIGVVALVVGKLWPWMFLSAGVVLAFGLRSLVDATRRLRALPSLPNARLRIPGDSK